MINIILADDHNIIRTSLKVLIEKHEEIKVVAEVADGLGVLELLEKGIKADIVLSDIVMPNLDGIGLISKIKAGGYDTKVVILSILDDEKYASNAFISGAFAYLLKDIEEEELLFCLKHVMKGKRYLSSNLCIAILERFNTELNLLSQKKSAEINFSEREINVLKLIADGFTNQEIADKLYLSRRTVESQREALINKTGTKNSASLVRFAMRNGYVS
ncbi:response regulator [Pedobacter zeae]|uniref:DNA-binding NarL/FixJ family response regulator n=1 Tax=Pedobacter zeae TaxID=1737356 RepID=A0A7W6KGY2_9SPHI|nr:response regulator transcription factor [Pedobacter zeae]MBB4110327.1 DNA-binding NarL/FixJ family response regulator [Pedobacter zeae]GGH17324.1 oxygen regulatory protein NreC [Pedobacter zeae]